MIVLDTSALVAIINHEPERIAFLETLADDERRLISAVTLFETRMVISADFVNPAWTNSWNGSR